MYIMEADIGGNGFLQESMFVNNTKLLRIEAFMQIEAHPLLQIVDRAVVD